MGGAPGDWAQLCRWGAESEGPQASQGWGTHQEAWGSQRQARGGNVEGQLNILMPEHGLLPLCGDAETAGKYKVFQIYSKILTCTQVQLVAPVRGRGRVMGRAHYHHPPGEAAGKPGSVRRDPFTTQEAGNTGSLWIFLDFSWTFLCCSKNWVFSCSLLCKCICTTAVF